MTAWCPRGCGRPSRPVLVNTSGKPALCRACKATQIGRGTVGNARLPRRRAVSEAEIDAMLAACERRARQQAARAAKG